MSVTEIVTGSGNGGIVFLSVIGGSMKQKVEEGTEGCHTREYEDKDGNMQIKHEITHKNIKGRIVGVEFDKKPWGTLMLEITVQGADGSKAQLSLADNSRYAMDFMEKFPNIDLGEEVQLNPFDFTPKAAKGKEAKRRTGVSIIQGVLADGEPNKIKTAYFDFDKMENLRGMPTVSREDADGYDSDDWTVFYLQKKKFLIKATNKIILEGIPVVAAVVKAEVTKKAIEVDENEPDDLPF